VLKVVSFSFIVCLIKEMFRLLLCSPHVARFHVRGVSIVSEHARSIQRGKLTVLNLSFMVGAVKVMLTTVSACQQQFITYYKLVCVYTTGSLYPFFPPVLVQASHSKQCMESNYHC